MINGRGLYEPRLFYVGLGCGDGKLLFNFNDNGVDMNRDQLADWLHCLEGGMYDWVADEIKKELAKPLPQPVAWWNPEYESDFAIALNKFQGWNVPLYALDEVKHENNT